MGNIFTLAKKDLTPGKKYNYCPYCYQKKKQELKNTAIDPTTTISPLIYNKTLEVYVFKNGEEKKYIDEFYICPNCKKRIDEKDFLKTYCVTPENEKYTDADFNKKPVTAINIKQVAQGVVNDN